MLHFPNFLTNQTDYTSTKISKILFSHPFQYFGPRHQKDSFQWRGGGRQGAPLAMVRTKSRQINHWFREKDLRARAYAMPMRACVFVWERIRTEEMVVSGGHGFQLQRERERERERGGARVLNLMRKRGARLWDERGIRVLKYTWKFCKYNLLVWLILSIQ